ncbi:MAG: sigma-70 family RNA polymerase sigma factor [Streptosporangiaceae bacterium]|nr:sigma-70 family RNA polymerase sigma factor [Streptosporangiaceae bacterium]
MDHGDNPVSWLVDAAGSGNERAWQEIVDRYAPLLASVIGRFRLTPAERQDIAQTVWLRLVEHLGSLREPRALPMWIITTGRRECMRCLSEQRRAVPRDPLDPSWLTTPAEEAEPAGELMRAERHEALLAGLAELPSRQRDLLLLLMEDPPLSYAQISERTGIAPGSIGPTRARALERLRHCAVVRYHVAER